MHHRISELVESQGWSGATLLGLLFEFIDQADASEDLDGRLIEFLEAKAEEENVTDEDSERAKS